MKKIEVQNITLMDKVETNEAQKLYEKERIKYIFLFIVPLLIFIVSTIYAIVTTHQNMPDISIILVVISLPLTITGFIIYGNKIAPYRELLNIAKLNDRIRHEEKIRVKERKRLEEEIKTTYTKKDIEYTKQQYNSNISQN